MILLCDPSHVKACFGLLGDTVNSTQDRCSICIECTKGTEIFMGIVWAERAIGLQIVLRTPNRTRR
jgi:hypothetical protein